MICLREDDVINTIAEHTLVNRTHPMTGDAWYECRCGWPGDEERSDNEVWRAHPTHVFEQLSARAK